MYYSGGFDDGAQVLILGYGLAGAVAAVTAHDAGAEVLIVERQPQRRRRPNSRFSGGLFIVPDDVDGAVHYMRRLYRINDELYETDPAVIRTWAAETAANVTWLTGEGGTARRILDHGEHPAIEGYDSISIYKPDMIDHPGTGQRGWGYGLFTFMQQRVAERGIRVMYDSRAQWLLTDADGAITGLRVQREGRELHLRAGRAVVMASGGFEFNERMKLDYLRLNPTHFYGNPENTGDGVAMALDVGADLWHMNSSAARLVAHFPDSGYPGGVPIDLWGGDGEASMRALLAPQPIESRPDGSPGGRPEATPGGVPGAIITDRYGRRFTSEVYRTHTLYYELANLDSHRLNYPKVPSWWIFDQRRLDAGPLSPDYIGPAGPLQEIAWSRDNREEVGRGWVRSAHSPERLAELIGMDPAVLSTTVRDYNRACRRGVDPDFGRPAATLTPLDAGPLHAVRLWPGGPNTQGGARRNPEARVMSVRGHPIPGLFSAGEFGSIYGMLYPAGGGNIAECLAFGRIAGRGAAAERSR